MTASRRSVLFERKSNAASNEIKRSSSEHQTDQTSDRSGVHPKAPENPAQPAQARALFSLEFLQRLVESTLASRI